MTFTPRQRPVVLCVLDGWGWRDDDRDNAIRLADTPNFDRLWRDMPHAFLDTSGIDVGLPGGQMGNSEVGHLNLGAGRVVDQDIRRIDAAIEDNSLATNAVLTGFINGLKASGGVCHLMGLISPGGVHSHQDQIAALAGMVSAAGVPVAIHAFLDGRDTPPRSADGFMKDFLAALDESLVPVLPEMRITRSFWLVTHRETAAFPQVRAMMDWLVEAVASERALFLPY